MALVRSLRTVLFLLVILAGSGCAERRGGLYEHDHVQPAHWPAGMAGAAEGIRRRVGLLRGGGPEADRTVAWAELRDIVGWVPEIAADSPLGEADWNPINELAGRLLKALGPAGTVPVATVPLEEDFERLCVLLDLAAAKVAAMSPDA